MAITPPVFTTLPRQSADDQTEVVPNDVILAAAIDANFAAFNAWKAQMDVLATPVRVTGTNLGTFPATNWTWATVNSGIDGYIVGKWCWLAINLKYTGPTITADSMGNISDVTMFTLKSQFWPGAYIPMAGVVTCGTAACAVGSAGQVNLMGLSYGGARLVTNGGVAVCGLYAIM